MKNIMYKLRGCIGSLIVFVGIAVTILGACIVKAGAWIGDIREFSEDIETEDLKQLYKEVKEARSKGRTKETKDE